MLEKGKGFARGNRRMDAGVPKHMKIEDGTTCKGQNGGGNGGWQRFYGVGNN